MVHQWVTQGTKRSINNARRPGRGSMMSPTINEESDCLRKKYLRRQQACCNLLTTCSRSVKSATCSKSVAFLAVYRYQVLVADVKSTGSYFCMLFANQSWIIEDWNTSTLYSISHLGMFSTQLIVTLPHPIKGTVQPFEWWFLRRISALLIEKTN
jgi:hypothetical protein